MNAEIVDVAPGLWIWRTDYPDWRPEAGWPPRVTSTCVASGGEVAVLETPLWLPEQRALVFADAFTAQDGELRVWATPQEERAGPALRRCSSCRSST
jgi:hypothetical protein